MSTRGAIAAMVLAASARVASAAGSFGGDRSGLPMTSAVFRAWIDGVTAVQRPVAGSGGYANDDDGQPAALAEALRGRPLDPEDPTAHVLSLGNGGSVVVTFAEAIHDGPGADFAVFENGFADGTPRGGDTNRYTFAELAFVEVATTTNAWARFPSQYLGTNVLYNFDAPSSNLWASQDVTLVDGLAGKHVIEFGTPFDLSALKTGAAVLNGSVDLRCIRYVRIVDVVGDGSTGDASGRPVYDPYFNFMTGHPNPAPPAANDGFDLRAIGLINSGGLAVQPSPQQAGHVIFSWFAVTNNTWQVQAAPSPAGPWSNLVSRAGDDTTVTITNAAAGGAGFYRLERNPSP